MAIFNTVYGGTSVGPKTLQELIAIGNGLRPGISVNINGGYLNNGTAVLTELNKYPVDYYNQFNSEQLLVSTAPFCSSSNPALFGGWEEYPREETYFGYGIRYVISGGYWEIYSNQ